MALALASWLRAAPEPSRVPWLQLPPQDSSGAATCPVASAPASRLRIALEPPRVPWLQLPPPGSGQLQSRHMSRDSSSRLMISIGARAYLPRRYVTRAVRACKACDALNASKTCGQSDCRTAPAQHRPRGPHAVRCHSAEWLNNSG
jgi:hypothetical protein